MKIKKTDYEIYFIDYFDGKLNPEETAELMHFLDQNPELKSEFEGFENICLPVENFTFENKDFLKKDIIQTVGKINADNYENFFIAFHEGELVPKEKAQTQSFIQKNPELEKEFEQFGKLYFQADTSIRYAKKEDLKKKAIFGRKIYYYSSAIAAAVLLLFSVSFLLRNNLGNQEQQHQTAHIFTLEPRNSSFFDQNQKKKTQCPSWQKYRQPLPHS
jgi:tellurite resistance protein